MHLGHGLLQEAAMIDKQGLAGQLAQCRGALEAARAELLALQDAAAAAKQEELPAWMVQSRSRWVYGGRVWSHEYLIVRMIGLYTMQHQLMVDTTSLGPKLQEKCARRRLACVSTHQGCGKQTRHNTAAL